MAQVHGRRLAEMAFLSTEIYNILTRRTAGVLTLTISFHDLINTSSVHSLPILNFCQMSP